VLVKDNIKMNLNRLYVDGWDAVSRCGISGDGSVSAAGLKDRVGTLLTARRS
jgi:hypothetical protein